MLQAGIDFGVTLRIQLILPARFVVAVLPRVPAREVTVTEAKSFLNQEGSVGVQSHVVGVVPLVAECVVNEAAQKGDIASSPDRYVAVRQRRRSIEARVDANELRFAGPFRLHNEAKTHGMVLGGVATHHQDDIRIGNVSPTVGHGASSEGGGQTGHRGAMSKPRLVFVGKNSHAKAKLGKQKVDFVGVRAATNQANIREAVNQAAVRVIFFETAIARLLDQPGHPIDRLFPRDRCPSCRARSAVQRPCQPLIVDNEFLQRNSFGAECSSVDRTVRISFDVDDGGSNIARLVTQGVDNHTAAHRAIGADAVCLGRMRDLQLSGRSRCPQVQS